MKATTNLVRSMNILEDQMFVILSKHIFDQW
jgi:hypothetical protein